MATKEIIEPLSPQSAEHENYDKLENVLEEQHRRTIGGFISGNFIGIKIRLCFLPIFQIHYQNHTPFFKMVSKVSLVRRVQRQLLNRMR